MEEGAKPARGLIIWPEAVCSVHLGLVRAGVFLSNSICWWTRCTVHKMSPNMRMCVRACVYVYDSALLSRRRKHGYHSLKARCAWAPNQIFMFFLIHFPQLQLSQ